MIRLSIAAIKSSALLYSHSKKVTVVLSSVILSDNASSSTGSAKGRQPRSRKTFPDKITCDWITPTDPVSNLRLIKFYVPPDETPAEREYRLMREDTQNWNQAFWTKHNRNFFELKEKFIKEQLEIMRADRQATTPSLTRGATSCEELDASSISPETMSLFYKKFLDDNYELHRDYNKEWYRRNIGQLWPAFKVQIERLFRRRRRTT
jgi:hypothetical protein